MSVDRLSTKFAALADPTRRAILARPALGETCLTELATPFETGTPAITKHPKVLESAGVITRSRQAQWRPCHLETALLQEAASFIEQNRQFREQIPDRLDLYLQTLQTKENNHGRKSKSCNKHK